VYFKVKVKIKKRAISTLLKFKIKSCRELGLEKLDTALFIDDPNA